MFLAWFIPIIVVSIVLFFVIAIKVGKKKKFISKIKIPHIDSKKLAGKKAERIVNSQIQILINNELKGQGKSHPNFIFFVDKYKQDTCEIDNLVVTKGGIFIIEVKGWKGEITGNLNDEKWTKTKKYHRTEFTYGYDIQSLDNPIQENDKHSKNFFNIWKNICSDIPKITPIVIFPYSKNPPEGTHNIESTFSLIIKLSKHGSYSVAEIENVILKIIEKYGATEEDHIKTINRLEQKHKSLSF